MRKLLFIVALFALQTLFSQENGGIKGTITDQAMNNEPMLFANIQVDGLDTSYQTNFHGNFEIDNLAVGKHTLWVSYARYESKKMEVEVKKNEMTFISAILSPMQLNFDEVSGMQTAEKDNTLQK